MKTKLAVRAGSSVPISPSAAPLCGTEILVPIDFSPASLQGLRHAVSLARETGAHLILLHVVEEPRSVRCLDVPGLQRARLAACTGRLKDLREQQLPPSITASVIVCEGVPGTEIIRQGAQASVGMTVLGARRHPWWQRPFRSLTLARVLGEAPCPVVVVKEQAAHRREKRSGTGVKHGAGGTKSSLPCLSSSR